MKRLIRVLAIVILATAFFCVAGLLALRFFPETEQVREGVQEKLRQATGQDIRLGSIKISNSFPDLIKLDVENVEVLSADGKKLLTVAKVAFTPELTALIKKEISVKYVEIDRFKMAVTRKQDGRITAPFMPVPVAAPETRPAPEAASPEPGKSGEPSRPERLKWSVKEVILTNGELVWNDESLEPGNNTPPTLSDINGKLVQESQSSFRADAAAKLAGKPIEIKGNMELSQDLSRPVKADFAVSVRSLPVGIVAPYVKKWSDLIQPFGSITLNATGNWRQAAPLGFAFKATLGEEVAQGPRLVAEGQGEAPANFSEIMKLRVDSNLSDFPVSALRNYLPDNEFVESETGSVKAELRGQWSGSGSWTAQAEGLISKVVPKGKLQFAGPELSVSFKAKADPGEIVIDGMELNGTHKIVSLTGKVARPLNDDRAADIKYELFFQPSMLKQMGVKIPKEVQLKGAVPIRGTALLNRNTVEVDAVGDVTDTAVNVQPYFEKAAGSKGIVRMKGKFPLFGSSRTDPVVVGLDLASARLRPNPEAEWLNTGLYIESKIVRHNLFALKDLSLILKSSGNEILNSKLNVGLESGEPKFDGGGALYINKDTLKFFNQISTSSVSINGSSSARAVFSGTPKSLNWTVEVPLGNLDIAVEQAFRKPAGVQGALKVSGRWAGDEVDVSDAGLTLPGLAMHGRCSVKEGRLRTAALDLKKSDLKDIVKYFPKTSNVKLAGPVEASVNLKPVDHKVLPFGTLKLLGVSVHPTDAGFGFDGLKGNIEASGNTLSTPELAASVAGAVQGPLKIKGSVENYFDVNMMNGRFSLEGGPGRVKADGLRNALKQINMVVETFLGNSGAKKGGDMLDFESLTGDIKIKSGTAITDNLKLKGAEVRLAVNGNMQLAPPELDIIAGMQTATVVGEAIGKIPAVQKLIKNNKEVLKATGLDKELRRFGIQIPESEKTGTQEKPDNSEPEKTAEKAPLTVFVKIKGATASPRVTPILEGVLEPATAQRLKALLKN